MRWDVVEECNTTPPFSHFVPSKLVSRNVESTSLIDEHIDFFIVFDEILLRGIAVLLAFAFSESSLSYLSLWESTVLFVEARMTFSQLAVRSLASWVRFFAFSEPVAPFLTQSAYIIYPLCCAIFRRSAASALRSLCTTSRLTGVRILVGHCVCAE